MEENSAEHKFTGPKREPTYLEPLAPVEPLEPLSDTFEPPPSNIFGFKNILNKTFREAQKADPHKTKIETKHSSMCSLYDKENQNECCGPNNRSPCCDYHQKVPFRSSYLPRDLST